MDLLKRELERKKKKVEKAKSSSGGKRYFRASELRQLEEEEDQADEEPSKRKRKLVEEEGQTSDRSTFKKQIITQSTTGKKTDSEFDRGNPVCDRNSRGKEAATSKQHKSVDTEAVSSAKLSPDEVTQRLRSFGHPIKLFGESTWDRLKRLQKALDEQKNVQAGLSEMEEFRLGKGHGIRNPFLERDEKNDEASHMEHIDDKPVVGGEQKSGDEKKSNGDGVEDLDENDPHKRVYKYFKGLVKQWEEDLNIRPESVKKSVAGRNETKTLKQCKDYIRPMFKLCKNRRMDEGILSQLNKIVSYCLEEEFVKAHDTYIDISIGRAAWPIGVTMVGIHARTGRAKIESSNVAHVMNSELQRKYLTSVKRLMSYAQKKSNADPSKKVL